MNLTKAGWEQILKEAGFVPSVIHTTKFIRKGVYAEVVEQPENEPPVVIVNLYTVGFALQLIARINTLTEFQTATKILSPLLDR